MRIKSLFALVSIFFFISCGSKQALNDLKVKKLAHIEFHGGSGTTKERAIIVKNAVSTYEGVKAEYAWLGKNHGLQNLDWQLLSQELLKERNKVYDIFKIKKIASQKEVVVYFDITDFDGK